MKNWNNREITLLIKSLEIKDYSVPGLLVMEEGRSAETIYIVKEGEFEVLKQKTSNVYMNSQSGSV